MESVPDRAEPQHPGPTKDVFNSWKADPKKKADSSQASIEAVNASLDAIAGRLDSAAARIDAIIKSDSGSHGPGVLVGWVEQELQQANRTYEYGVLTRHKAVQTGLGTKSLARITSSEQRLKDAIARAKTFAKDHGQTLNTQQFVAIEQSVDNLLDAQKLKPQDLERVEPQASSAEDLRGKAITEHLEAALARAQVMGVGGPDSVTEYMSHLTSVFFTADGMLQDRAVEKKNKKTPAQLSGGTKKELRAAMSTLSTEVKKLVAKNPTKWADVNAKTKAANDLVNRL
ncbi:MAG TPA: hypothetical protein VFG30_38345 [Polyangiales bacterium]|nr:hypothetical protein [Polyangiales bacterium]